MNLEQMIDRLERVPEFMMNVTCWQKIPAKDPV